MYSKLSLEVFSKNPQRFPLSKENSELELSTSLTFSNTILKKDLEFSEFLVKQEHM